MALALRIFGLVKKTLELGVSDLSDFPAESQIPDIRGFVKGRNGAAVRLRVILDMCVPEPSASHVAFRSRDGFLASVPLDVARDRGMVVYRTAEGSPLPAALGGPFRLFIPEGGTTCDNVKDLTQIEITAYETHRTIPKGEPEVAKFVRVAEVAAIPFGKGIVVENHEKPISIFHTEEGFFAINHVCPHRGGPLGEGTLCGMLVTCPWHGWRFDVRTGFSERKNGHTIATYEVKVEGKDIFLGWLKKGP